MKNVKNRGGARATRCTWLAAAVVIAGASGQAAWSAPGDAALPQDSRLAQVQDPMPGIRPNIPPVQAPAPVPSTQPDIDVTGRKEGTTRSPLYIYDQALKASSNAVQVEAVSISGNRVITDAELAALAAPYQHRKLEPTEIEALRNALTMLYINRGYTNSGALPPKYDEKTQTLNVAIVEGKLTEVHTHGNGWLRSGYIAERLQGRSDAVFNMNDLRDRFQDFLADPLIERANAKLLPGAQPGEAILDVDVERARPYGVTLLGNNYRPPAIGSHQIGVDAWVRNLSTFGDLLDVSYLKHPGGANLGSITRAANWHLPIDAGRGEFSIEADEGASNIVEAALLPLGINNKSKNQNIELKERVWRVGLSHQMTVGVDWLHRSTQSWWLGGIPDTTLTVANPQGVLEEHGLRLWDEFSWRTERQVAVARLTYSRTDNNVASTPLADVHNHVQYYQLQAQYSRAVAEDGTQVVTRAILQQSPDSLPSIDQISVGGISTVRGYEENEFIRDSGRVLSVGLDHPYKLFSDALTGSVGPFTDWAQARNTNPLNGEQSEKLGSVGVYWRAVWRTLKIDLTYAKRLLHPIGAPTYSSSLQDHGIELQVSYDLFPKSATGK